MKKTCLSFLLLSSTFTLFGALSPLAQSIKEMQAILADTHIQDLGSAEAILEIVKVDTGYLVISQNYSMLVDVTYKTDQKKVGPVPFQLQFHAPETTTRGEQMENMGS